MDVPIPVERVDTLRAVKDIAFGSVRSHASVPMSAVYRCADHESCVDCGNDGQSV